tara:strand:- start:473 stop:1360 length:888 start_codon:yes stop_codon:yes gene_type:complete
MVKIYTVLVVILFNLNAHALDFANKIEKNKAEKLDEYVSNLTEYIINLIPGEGISEVSINLRENYKPDFSILGTRELKKLNNGNYFMQFSLNSTEKLNDERYTGNLGFGTRRLSDDKNLLTGLNLFFDYDDEENARGSVGVEVKNAVLQFTSNYYKKIDNGTEFEKVLDGYDIQLTSQVPYLHWANMFVNTYKWYGVERDDVEGRKYGSELSLTPSLNLEIVYDDKRLKGLKDEYYARLSYIYPPRTTGPTVLDGVSRIIWEEEKDMSDELLTKVKRNNRIFVEYTGSAIVSRMD